MRIFRKNSKNSWTWPLSPKSHQKSHRIFRNLFSLALPPPSFCKTWRGRECFKFSQWLVARERNLFPSYPPLTSTIKGLIDGKFINKEERTGFFPYEFSVEWENIDWLARHSIFWWSFQVDTCYRQARGWKFQGIFVNPSPSQSENPGYGQDGRWHQWDNALQSKKQFE